MAPVAHTRVDVLPAADSAEGDDGDGRGIRRPAARRVGPSRARPRRRVSALKVAAEDKAAADDGRSSADSSDVNDDDDDGDDKDGAVRRALPFWPLFENWLAVRCYPMDAAGAFVAQPHSRLCSGNGHDYRYGSADRRIVQVQSSHFAFPIEDGGALVVRAAHGDAKTGAALPTTTTAAPLPLALWAICARDGRSAYGQCIGSPRAPSAAVTFTGPHTGPPLRLCWQRST
jgi:hypothetical protein